MVRPFGDPDPFSGSMSGDSGFLIITGLWSEDGAARHSPSCDNILRAHTEPQTCDYWEQNPFLICWEEEFGLWILLLVLLLLPSWGQVHPGHHLGVRAPPSLLSSKSLTAALP